MNALLGELHMVKVLHQQSGVCLFTHQWKWKPQAHAEGVGALVMSFTQFAREIDGGGAVLCSVYTSCMYTLSNCMLYNNVLEVVQVHFDPSQTDKKDRQSSSFMPVSTG